MWIERLDASHALDYRALMLEAYDLHPQAFTSSVRERAVMPLSWWASRLSSTLDVVFGAFENAELAGIVGNDAAFNLYQRCGFIPFGLEPLAVRVGEDYFDKIHMWREL